MKTWLGLLIALLPWIASASNASLDTQFDAANKLYAQSKFADAAAAYEQITTGGAVSAALYFNLGNAYFKAGQLGRALAAYRQAETLTPRDPDLRANTQFARKQVQGPKLTPPRWQTWLHNLSPREWLTLATVAVWVTLGLFSARLIQPALTAPLRPWTWAAVGASLAIFTGTALALSDNPARRSAIVVVTDATVRNSPFDESAAAFTAHDGAELRVLDHKDDWLQVTDGGRHVGWIKRAAVELAERS